MRKPFYRKQCKAWYVKDERGKFIRLDEDEETAYQLWERMRQLANFDRPDATIESLCEAFLRFNKPRMSQEKLDRAIYFLSEFCKHVGPTTRASKIVESDLLEWLNKKRVIKKESRQWSVARKRDAGQVIKRMSRWCQAKGYLTLDPFALVQFEQPDPRDVLITHEEHQLLIAEAMRLKRGRAFATFLMALRCGARPIQIRDVKVENVAADYSHWVFKQHKTKKKTKKNLIVQLTPCLQTLTKILCESRKEGHLFLTTLGEPWTKDAVALRFRRMRDRLKLNPAMTIYSYRHTFATDALLSGVDIAMVAVLLGHSDISMVARNYGHLAKHSISMHKSLAIFAKKRLIMNDQSNLKRRVD